MWKWMFMRKILRKMTHAFLFSMKSYYSFRKLSHAYTIHFIIKITCCEFRMIKNLNFKNQNNLKNIWPTKNWPIQMTRTFPLSFWKSHSLSGYGAWEKTSWRLVPVAVNATSAWPSRHPFWKRTCRSSKGLSLYPVYLTWNLYIFRIACKIFSYIEPFKIKEFQWFEYNAWYIFIQASLDLSIVCYHQKKLLKIYRRISAHTYLYQLFALPEMNICEKYFKKITSLSLLSRLNKSSDSNLAFWSGTTLGILKMNLGFGCSYKPIESNGNIPASAAASLIECIFKITTVHNIQITKKIRNETPQTNSNGVRETRLSPNEACKLLRLASAGPAHLGNGVGIEARWLAGRGWGAGLPLPPGQWFSRVFSRVLKRHGVPLRFTICLELKLDVWEKKRMGHAFFIGLCVYSKKMGLRTVVGSKEAWRHFCIFCVLKKW